MAQSDSPLKSAAARRVAAQPASSPPDLTAQLENIEEALGRGDLQRGATLLNELIDRARAHFIQDERMALGVELTADTGERLMHNALVERARSLKARCFNRPANTEFNVTIRQELASLLADLADQESAHRGRHPQFRQAPTARGVLHGAALRVDK